MKRNEINLRDPFVLPYDGKYYLYGSRGGEVWEDKATGLDVYVSSDLENWSEPKEIFTPPDGFWADRHFWAPEVYEYNGAFYMFASFKSACRRRGTMVLKSAVPDGNFTVHSEGTITPPDWEALDGTFYIARDGSPYMIFCREWVQIGDGQICAVKMSGDLKKAQGEPFTLFRASEASWIAEAQKDKGVYITDGPFLYRCKNGTLLMLWSSMGSEGYTEAIAVSDNGDIDGRWIQRDELLFKKDGGHGMIFKSFDGRLLLALHSPNKHPLERPAFFELEDKNGMLYLKK